MYFQVLKCLSNPPNPSPTPHRFCGLPGFFFNGFFLASFSTDYYSDEYSSSTIPITIEITTTVLLIPIISPTCTMLSLLRKFCCYYHHYCYCRYTTFFAVTVAAIVTLALVNDIGISSHNTTGTGIRTSMRSTVGRTCVQLRNIKTICFAHHQLHVRIFVHLVPEVRVVAPPPSPVFLFQLNTRPGHTVSKSIQRTYLFSSSLMLCGISSLILSLRCSKMLLLSFLYESYCTVFSMSYCLY